MRSTGRRGVRLVVVLAALSGQVLPVPQAGALGVPSAAAGPPMVSTLAPSSGTPYGGTSVTITGSGFVSGAIVTFGSEPSPFVRVDSDSSVTAFTPAGSSGATVPVTVSVGAVASRTGPVFTYADGDWAATAPMGASRAGHGATLLADGRVLVDTCPFCQADTPGGILPSTVYDPGGPSGPPTWRTTGRPSAFRWNHTSTLLPDGNVLIAGGVTSAAPQAAASSTEVFDPELTLVSGATTVSGGWRASARLGQARQKHAAVRLGSGKVLVAGGHDQSGLALSSAELYDSTTSTWSGTGSLVTARTGHTMTLLADGRVLAVGGRRAGNGALLASSELYDPATGKWTSTAGAMNTPRADQRASLLGDGRVLVTGGHVQGPREFNPTASAELFNPVTGTWSSVAPMAVARAGHTSTSLADGRVLVAGGNDGTVKQQNGLVLYPGVLSAQIFNPATSDWTPAASLSVQRVNHSATLLSDGRVMVAGGDEPNPLTSKSLASAEVFDPSFRPVPRIDGVEPDTGPVTGGTKVKITGAYLYGSPLTVRFGANVATAVTAVSDRELIADSPLAPAGPAFVTVTTPVGASPQTAAGRFTFVPGSWAKTSRLDGCDPARACGGRTDQEAVVLDAPSCHASPPTGDYPCGKVLLAGRVGRKLIGTMPTDGVPIITTRDPVFTHDDVGAVIDAWPGDANNGPTPNRVGFGARVRSVINSNTIDFGSGTGPAATSGTSPSNTDYFSFTLSDTSAQVYDPGAGSWTAAAPMRGHRSLSLRWALPSFTVTLLGDGNVLVVGGCCEAPRPSYGFPALASAEIYHPADNSWSDAAPMPGPAGGRVGHTATLLDGPACRVASSRPDYCGKVLVAGGVKTVNDGVNFSGVGHIPYFYNLLQLADQPLLYDPVRNTWSDAGSIGQGRHGHTATLLGDGDVLVMGGVNGEDTTLGPAVAAEIYHPADKTWHPTRTAPAENNVRHTATLLDPLVCAGSTPPPGYPCGQVLVAGGTSSVDRDYEPFGDGLSRSIQLYDPRSGTWTTPSSLLLAPRAGHTTTLLPDGTLLIAGGRGADVRPEVQPQPGPSEVFDPATGKSTLVPAMGDARSSHAAALLAPPACTGGRPLAGYPCNKVLVAGGTIFDPTGQSPPSRPLPSAELFTAAPYVTGLVPATGRSTGGDMVDLTGVGLGEVTGVSFGGVASTQVTVVSPSRVNARTPPHLAGSVKVEVTTIPWPEGTSAAGRAATFAYHASDEPAAVTDLLAQALSDNEIKVTFAAVASDGTRPPPAAEYILKQARTPIADEAAFAAAVPLCGGLCTFGPATVGAPLTITISDLNPGTTYHYAVRAVLSDGRRGPLSNLASATTTGAPPGPPPCPVLPPPGPGQVAYPAGYSLVGLPSGTLAPTADASYGWFDAGAGGRYSIQPATVGLEAGRGYWSWSPCPRLVSLLQPGQDQMSFPIGAYHASMVGNPSSSPVTVSGYDYAARWDHNLNDGAGGYVLSSYRQPLSLAVGEGMWVISYAAATIEIKR